MENKKSHYFYVLLCQDGSFYGGYTTEPAEAAFKKLTRKQKEQYLKTFH